MGVLQHNVVSLPTQTHTSLSQLFSEVNSPMHAHTDTLLAYSRVSVYYGVSSCTVCTQLAVLSVRVLAQHRMFVDSIARPLHPNWTSLQRVFPYNSGVA